MNNRRPMQDAVERLLGYHEKGEWTKREIADELRWGYRQAESAVDKLAKRGVVSFGGVDIVTGATIWRLT